MGKAVVALLGAGALFVSGCLPFPYGPYWQPAADGGVPVRAWCGEQVGPFSKLRLELEPGLSLEVTVEEVERPYVSLLFRVEGAPLEGAGRTRLATRDGDLEVEAAISEWALERGDARRTAGGWIFLPEPGDPAVGRVDTRLPAAVGSRFTYWLPALRRAGRTLAPRAVRFERRRFDGGIQPFNC